MRLGLHAPTQQYPEVYRRRVVDLRKLKGKVGVVPCLLRIAEQAEGDHGDIDVAASEGQLDGRSMGFMITSVKIDFSDLATEADEFGRCSRTPLARPGGKHHAQSGTGVPSGDRQSDVRGAAE